MSINQDRIKYLLEQYARHVATEDEVNELFIVIRTAEQDDFLKGWMVELLHGMEPAAVYDQARWDKVVGRVINGERKLVTRESGVVRKMQLWKRIAVAASILLVVGLGSYFMFFNKAGKQTEIVTNDLPKDVEAPKGTKAMITLADGRMIALDSVTSGTLVAQGNVQVVKNTNGEIVYQSIVDGQQSTVQYNTLFNPRGSKVQSLTLSDGTKVWLNSESSLKYPIAFAGNERKVEITGEAYFEVKSQKSKVNSQKIPFFVESNGVVVEVLGTHFNVNAYDDETDIKVTLLEGSVQVSASSAKNFATSAVKIKPGEQAVLTHNSPLTIHHPNLAEVMAWKNGTFQLNAAGIETIMRQIARWYDVEIIYQGPPVKQVFYGTISRTVSAANVFKVLEETGGVHFKIEGRKVTVMK